MSKKKKRNAEDMRQKSHGSRGIAMAGIGLYREIAIAIQKESGDSNGGNV